MKNAMDRVNPLIILALAVGSLGCSETRFLSCQTRDPRVEAKSYDLHDPFPDESMGPETFSRPRTFQEPRSDTRKSLELRNLQASRGVTPPAQLAWEPSGGPTTAGMPLQPVWRQPTSAVPLTTKPGFWDVVSPQYSVVPY